MTTASKSYWEEIIQKWQQSGCNMTEFCRRECLSIHTFKYWKYKLAGGRSSEAASQELLKISEPAKLVLVKVAEEVAELPEFSHVQPNNEVGHCEFDRENTRLFFDLIDRRYQREGCSNIIFTSNKNPSEWKEDFQEDNSLLCAMDRIFDDATVFSIRGESFRGKKQNITFWKQVRLKVLN